MTSDSNVAMVDVFVLLINIKITVIQYNNDNYVAYISYLHTYIHMYACTHAHTHTHTHTHIYIYIYIHHIYRDCYEYITPIILLIIYVRSR